jgi:hypothetical protein
MKWICDVGIVFERTTRRLVEYECFQDTHEIEDQVLKKERKKLV